MEGTMKKQMQLIHSVGQVHDLLVFFATLQFLKHSVRKVLQPLPKSPFSEALTW